MKQLLLFMLVLVGGVGQVWADGKMYLRNNISTDWETDDDRFASEKTWDSANSQDIYEFTINADVLGDNDFYFRLNRWDSDGKLICPYGHTDYAFTFDNGAWENYSAPRVDQFQGNNGAFKISHSTIKASQYKITVYLKYNENVSVDGNNYSGVWAYYIKVEIVSMPVEIKSVGAATFSCDRALDFSSLSSSFTAKAITGVSGVTLTKSDALTTVPANTGLYLEGTAGTYDVPVIETGAASAVGTNLLIAQSTAGSVSQTVGEGASKKTNYILTNKTVNGSADLKFYKVNAGGNTVGAGKAYLQIDTPEGGGSAREYLWFDETTTGVSEQVAAKSGNAGAVYNLSGQRVAQPTRGLYIVNGKKYIVK